MTSAGFLDSLPDNLADLFAVLYDWYEIHCFPDAINCGLDKTGLLSLEFRRLKSLVEQSGWEVPAEISDLLVGLPGSRQEIRFRLL